MPDMPESQSILSNQIAKHFREVHVGGNWTVSNFQEHLKDLKWTDAIKKVDSYNTIATLVYHTHYFVKALLNVLQGNRLDAHDKFSFSHPPMASQKDWDEFVTRVFADASECADLIEKLPDSIWWKDFDDVKYGNYYRNVHGTIEHLHYHLGQIVILKKLLAQ